MNTYAVTADSLGPSCPVKSNDWPACIKASIERARPFLAKGDFGEGFIVPKLEPLFIKKLAMESSDVNVTIHDLLVNGPSNFQVKKVKYDRMQTHLYIYTII